MLFTSLFVKHAGRVHMLLLFHLCACSSRGRKKLP